MKILLDIKDEKASFFMELLKNFPFVKAKLVPSQKPDIDSDNEVIKGLKESVEQVNLAKEGKIKLKPVRQLLDGL